MQPIYQIDVLPVLQNRVFDSKSAAQACQTGSLRLVQDVDTGFVFNQAFDPQLLIYDENYNNEQSLSPAFQKHLMDVKRVVQQFLGETNLMEVGCGKGYFLELLRGEGFDICGCDPTYEGQNPTIIKKFYSDGLGVHDKNIVLRHVLEHIPQPVSFLQMIGAVNRGGRIYIEVPCLDWIAANRAWFDLFYEHCNYFRLADLNAMFGKVHQSGRLFGGQYLYIVAELSTIKKPQRIPGDDFRLPQQFQPDFARLIHQRRIAIWGAASKGVIYSLHAMRNSIPITCAIDVNPAKHNKYLPVTGVPVISPVAAVNELPEQTHVVIMNSNYSEEIRNMSSGKFTYSLAEYEPPNESN